MAVEAESEFGFGADELESFEPIRGAEVDECLQFIEGLGKNGLIDIGRFSAGECFENLADGRRGRLTSELG